MRRLAAVSAIVVGLVSPAWAQADDDADETDESTDEQRFQAFAALGDREAAAGRPRAAVAAYRQALKLRPDPLIAGRLGVLLVQLGKPEQATDHLLDALQLAVKATPAERKRFFEAHEVARDAGAWIEVLLSHAGVRVTIDGKPKNCVGRSSFWIFMRTGEHELRATLDGYEEAIVPFTVKKREDKQLPVTLIPLPMPAPPAPAVYEPEKDPPKVERVVVGGDAKLPKQEDPWGYEDPRPAQKSDEKRWSIGGGPVAVFGVASWMPAVGIVAEGRWRANEYVSLGLEGRAAWLTAGVADRPISAMTAGGIVSGCGHWRWLYGCAIGHIGVINIEFSRTSYEEQSSTLVKPGVGGRIGAELHVGRSVALKASIDALGLTSGLQVIVGQTRLVEQPPVLIGTQIGATWEF
ncbi:tetratricopeptide repeat protein [Polyangium sp. 6x1]|uniref:tetratricopeptide repeat protein n=1 Tax=Polyangium sp. 6x1 TaxID=3042689 RepID=UPI0024829D13|nr:tetratricopeptide repeat protein [Polyangium sp. 6x1]MDI1442414.1 tetratricopeptide repeat protein [Polyangium sp. 6x1]